MGQLPLSGDMLDACQKAIGYQFANLDLLSCSLMHASVASCRLDSNERMEFLGDAVLGLVICEELYRRFPEYLEGELTKIKSLLVSRRSCAQVADHIGLGQFLQLGKGMHTRSHMPSSLSACAVEALICAVYADGGLDAARKFILSSFHDVIEEAVASTHLRNFKSILQQFAQQHFDRPPSYEVLDEKGPDHAKCFEIAVRIGERRFPSAWGPAKKEAEQSAARLAIKELAGQFNDPLLKV